MSNYGDNNPADIAKIKVLRALFIRAEHILDESCPSGHELALAKTKLDEARMWAISAVVAQWPPESIVTGDPTIEALLEVRK